MGGRERIEHAPGSARELLAVHVGQDPYEQIDELRKLGDEKAKWSGVVYQMEHGRKALLSRLATEYARTHSDKNLSEAKLDRLAHADDRYKDHLEATRQAIEKKERAESDYWAARSLMEWDRHAIAHLNVLSRLEEPA